MAFRGITRTPDRSSVWSCNADGWDYYRLLEYLSTEPRRLEYLAVAGTDWNEYVGSSMVEFGRHCRSGTTGAVAALFGTFQGPSPCSDCTRSTGGAGDPAQVCAKATTSNQARRRAQTHTEDTLYDILCQNPVSPLTNVTRTPMWLERSDLRFIRLDDRRLQRAIQVFNEQMCNWTTLNFITLYEQTNPLFDAPHGNLAQYYVDVEQSYMAMVGLLEYQFGSAVPEFVHALYDLLERRIPKKNCMEIVSAPSAGKNFSSMQL
ncbi:unnamed protein product [Ixodes hexagonus]